ncbi:MAG: ATP-binding protein [Gemmatimonadota bacterium]
MLLWLAAGSLVAFLGVFAVGGGAVGAALRRIEDEDVVAAVTRARLLLQRQGIRHAETIREYAWWTETWTYIDAPRTPQAERFIRENYVDWLPGQYGDRFIAIWSADRRRVFLWADSSALGVESAFEGPGAFDAVDRMRSMGGFVTTPRGLFLAAFSVVVRTEDVTAAGPSHGYAAIARPVTEALLQEWSAATQERLTLRAAAREAALLGDSAVSRRIAGGDSVATRFAVHDLYGQPTAIGVVTISRAFFGGLRTWIITIIGVAGFLGLAVIAALWLVGLRTLVQPLEMIAQALARMRATGHLSAVGAPAAAREWSVFVGAFNETVDALHASEERYRTLFRQAADALFVVEGEGQRIVDANPAAERLTRASRADLLGRSLSDLLVRQEDAPRRPGTYRLLRGHEPAATVEVLTGNAEVGPQRLTLASVRDLTEREALEEQVRQAQKMEVLGRLAGGIAHDFNNLLGAVLMSASSLRDELPADHPAQASTQTIERTARRAAELTRQLLSFARREGVRREPVAVEDLVSGVRQLCQRTFGHAVEIAVVFATEGVTVMGDAGQLEQALLNLSLNARDAMPEGGAITIEVRLEDVGDGETGQVAGLARGSYVVLSVVDTGVGIPPEVRTHLFEPFFTTKERGKGTGLGLATTYGIVQSHGGTIRVHSEVGHGSRFDVYLPQARVPAAAPAASEGHAPRGSETILLVDDEGELRKALDRALTRLGYAVVTASNGREAVALFSERPDDFAMVLLDVLMPEMGGVEAFRAIRALRPQARVLAITGHAAGEEIQQLIEGGVEGVLPKPFTIPEIAVTMRRILDRATTSKAPA